ncbi:hypothetical protein BpOF4_20534 (plasmid) [Alkalihalophilus pseudofirmus OF4]|uniref:Phage abortive infection protein n=1 Tax=Alkalihalophilus pseudofirmus (strain ATCC BAA-2126 / JCM 17055 / OF4) TaxID=398511 RepID=D3G176_ALKPO|nr:hypothetical protein [Alkalihalophilus pseudofirmus]ADC52102.1 hypothetical protein BpOF4_20534 [Alkalihalophilus pseudofirmus OF4]
MVVGFILVYFLEISFVDLAPYGDFISGSTIPFFTIITILYIIRTINLQKKQIILQQTEVTLLREEIESAKTALQEQSKTTRMQRFESTFFTLIEELKKTINNLEIANKARIYKGKKCLEIMQERLHDKMEATVESKLSDKESFEKELNNKFKNSTILFYGDIAEKCYLELDKTDEYSYFLNNVQQTLMIIAKYKGLMEPWEEKFYTEYLIQQVGNAGMYLFTYNTILRFDSDCLPIIRELNILEFSNRYSTPSPSDYDLFKTVVEEDLDVTTKFNFS